MKRKRHMIWLRASIDSWLVLSGSQGLIWDSKSEWDVEKSEFGSTYRKEASAAPVDSSWPDSFLRDSHLIFVLHGCNLANCHADVSKAVISANIFIHDIGLEGPEVKRSQEMEAFFPNWRRVVFDSLDSLLMRVNLVFLGIQWQCFNDCVSRQLTRKFQTETKTSFSFFSLYFRFPSNMTCWIFDPNWMPFCRSKFFKDELFSVYPITPGENLTWTF